MTSIRRGAAAAALEAGLHDAFVTFTSRSDGKPSAIVDFTSANLVIARTGGDAVDWCGASEDGR